jgi:hypothetical protein
MKYTHRLADHNEVTQYIFFLETAYWKSKGVLFLRTILHHNQITDTTAQAYCTLNTFVTTKTISYQNQKSNTTPQLCGTLSTLVCNTKTYFPPETKKLTQQHNWEKKVPPAHAQQVYSFLCLSFCPSVSKG